MTVGLRAPVIVIVLAATAVPIELLPVWQGVFGFGMSTSDVLANIAGYVPVGLVLCDLGLGKTLLVAVVMSSLAETCQLAMVHRNPSAVDVVSNTIGALLGVLAANRWNIRLYALVANRWKGLIAGLLAAVLLVGAWATSGYAPNSHGATSPGGLEAYWKLDESDGTIAIDSSPNSLSGTFSGSPSRLDGILGNAVKFVSPTDYIDFGKSTPLRLAGSTTITAWINSSAFPVDDAAIVSNHNELGQGYQLDTTIDRGPRTIGFKLANECGNLMARYGATPLVVGTWYHIAGVYSSPTRTLDVYLNGKLDNGSLLGFVTGTQRSSRESVYVGRRGDPAGFEFAGSIDDVRIYSRALNATEVAAVMQGSEIDHDASAQGAPEDVGEPGRRATLPQGPASACRIQSDREDKELPGAAAALGVLVAVATVGFWPASGSLPGLVATLVAGLLLLCVTTPTLPLLGRCMLLLATLAGGFSVLASRSH